MCHCKIKPVSEAKDGDGSVLVQCGLLSDQAPKKGSPPWKPELVYQYGFSRYCNKTNKYIKCLIIKEEENKQDRGKIKTYFSVVGDVWSVESELLVEFSSIKTISNMGSEEQFSKNTSRHTR